LPHTAETPGDIPFGRRGLVASSGVATHLHPQWLYPSLGDFVSRVRFSSFACFTLMTRLYQSPVGLARRQQPSLILAIIPTLQVLGFPLGFDKRVRAKSFFHRPSSAAGKGGIMKIHRIARSLVVFIRAKFRKEIHPGA